MSLIPSGSAKSTAMARRRALSSIVLAFLAPGAAGTAIEFRGHRVVSPLEFRTVGVAFRQIFEFPPEPRPRSQELRVVESREINDGLHGLPQVMGGSGLAFPVRRVVVAGPGMQDNNATHRLS